MSTAASRGGAKGAAHPADTVAEAAVTHASAPRRKRKDPLIGRTINGRFTVIELIARGGMGKVYKAEQEPLGRICALKVLNPKYEGDDDPEFQRRFFLEASTASKLSHPNTVTIFDYGRDEDIYYIAMEYVRGRTLYQLLREEGTVSEPRVAHIIRQVARSLREAHAIGVIHRDMKPANVVLLDQSDEADAVKVLDFGLVKQVAEGEAEDLTQQGLFMGSPKYMAPEQILGHRVGAATDIYALGVLAYELLSGRVPFDLGASVKTLMAHVNDVPPSLRQACPEIEVSAAMESIVMRCLAKELEDRFQDMDALLRELTQIEGGGSLTDSLLQAPAVRPPPSASGAHRLRSSPPGAKGSAMMTRPLSPDHVSYPPSAPASGAPPRASGVPPGVSLPPASSASITQRSEDLDIELQPRRGRRAVAVVLFGLVAVIGVLVWLVAGESAVDSDAGDEVLASTAPLADTAASTVAPPSAAPAVRTLHVTSTPPGAKVEEAGKVICGATPCDVTWRDGQVTTQHELVFTKAGYRKARSMVTADMTEVSGKLVAYAPAPRATATPTQAPPSATPKTKGLSGYKDSPY